MRFTILQGISLSTEFQKFSAGDFVSLPATALGTASTTYVPESRCPGVIVRTPVDDEDKYSVLLADSRTIRLSEKALEPWPHPDLENPHLFDFRNHIVYSAVVGSRAYGLETRNSDTDIRGVYLAPVRTVLSMGGFPGQFEDHHNQSCHWELQKFLTLLCQSNPTALETLFSPDPTCHSQLADELRTNRQRFLSRQILQTFHGYADRQFLKMQRDLRTHDAVRWKHAMHLIRLLISGTETLQSGNLILNVAHHRQQLLDIKNGLLSFDQVTRLKNELSAAFNDAASHSPLPDTPDSSFANSFLINSRISSLN